MKGSTIWYLQRTSAIINLIYIVYVFYFICSTELTFEAWSNFFYSSIMIFLTLCFFASVIIHSFIGLWTVGTDYLTRRTIGFYDCGFTYHMDGAKNEYQNVSWYCHGYWLQSIAHHCISFYCHSQGKGSENAW